MSYWSKINVARTILVSVTRDYVTYINEKILAKKRW